MTVESALIDSARAVRQGEELDEARLLDFLQKVVPDLPGPLLIEQFPSGYSNLTYLLTIGDRQLVLRRPPFGAKIKTAHDMGREYRILTHLYPVYPKVPRPLAFCEDESVIGAPFYVMERVNGIILRAQPPQGLDLSPEVMRRLSQTFVENLAEIHGVDYTSAGLGQLGIAKGYVKRQVDGWTRRYFNAKTDDFPNIEKLALWLAQNQPSTSESSALIHNDYKFDNLVLSTTDLGKVLAVLDWEMATIGEPLMDLGTTLGYWVEADDPEEWQRHGFGLTKLPGSFTRAEVVAHYESRSGGRSSNLVFYYAYGLLKIAVIVQQIFFRYRKGLTKDPRFAGLGSLMQACGLMALRAIEKNRIDRLG